ncbi:MAG: sugar transferase [Bryobacteraceae bacterium]
MWLFRVYIPGSVLGLLFSEVVLLFSVFLLAVIINSDVDPEIWLLYSDGWMRLSVIVGGVVLSMYFQDLYEIVRVRSRIALIQQVCIAIGLAFLLQALLSYTAPDWVLPRWITIIACGLTLLLLPTWRLIYSTVALHAVSARKVLFLGSSKVACDINSRIRQHPELGMATLGFVDDALDSELSEDTCHLGQLKDFRSIISSTKPDLIVVGMSERRSRLPINQLLDLRFAGIRIEDAATTYETTFGRVCLQEIRPSQLVFSTDLGARPGIVRLQTVYSTLIALAGTVITLPLLILIAALVKFTSRGPVFYRQLRVGLNGTKYTVYKFRSMRHDAEADTGPTYALRDDPRATFVGRLLRRLRLDELPQLFNVLKGEMSIVGPRPERPEFVDTLAEKIPFYRQRLCIKPGITGWAQINHKYGDSFEDTSIKLEYDLYYIKNLSPTLDAYIIFHTLKVMLLSRGSR